MRYALILMSLMVLASTSCKKDDQEDLGCDINRQIDNNSGVVTTILYNSGKPTQVEQSNGNSGKISYNANGEISLYEIFLNNVKIGYVEFEYTTDNRFLERRTYAANLFGSFNLKLRDVYEYTGSNVTKVTNYDTEYSNTSINGYITYTYNASGNVTEEKQHGRDGSNNIILVRTLTFTYDDKPTPAGDLGKYISIFSNNNPMQKVTTTYFPNADSSTETYEYIYNSKGYPTKVTIINSSGNPYSYQVEYECHD